MTLACAARLVREATRCKIGDMGAHRRGRTPQRTISLWPWQKNGAQCMKGEYAAVDAESGDHLKCHCRTPNTRCLMISLFYSLSFAL